MNGNIVEANMTTIKATEGKRRKYTCHQADCYAIWYIHIFFYLFLNFDPFKFSNEQFATRSKNDIM